MLSPTVVIAGCGVAGPVLALLLKKKGYTPVVLEKVKQLGDAGASLMLMPNGLKVLSLVGLADKVTQLAPHLSELRDQKSTGEDLGVSHLPSRWQKKYGQPACGVKRTILNLLLKDALIEAGIEIHEGWKLKDIIEQGNTVLAISEDGQAVEGAILVGCDGIKAVSRALLRKQRGLDTDKATYTGLIQTAGMSPTPPSLKARPGLLNLYGPGAHFISYPVSDTTTSWAITSRDLTEAQETWKIFSSDEKELEREQLLKKLNSWASPVPELIKGAERIIKYGLYDRPQLDPEQWFSPNLGRCILIGDAAHPTSPHLGQGANQALEDCYHLSYLLPDLMAKPQVVLSSIDLAPIFHKFATLRQPRTAALVKGARIQGDRRVIDDGPAASEERDNLLRNMWKDEAAIEEKYNLLLREPFS